MQHELVDELKAHRDHLHRLLRRYAAVEGPFLLRSQLIDLLEEEIRDNGDTGFESSQVTQMIRQCQEAASDGTWILFARRPRIGDWSYDRIHIESLDADVIDVGEYLRFKERLIDKAPAQPWSVEVDLGPFGRDFPRLQEADSIGQGVSFLNRRLSSELFRDGGTQKLIDFLRVHHVGGRQLMLSRHVKTVKKTQRALRAGTRLLKEMPPDKPWAEIEDPLRELGFEPGWGRDVERTLDSFRLLSDVLEAPGPSSLERLLARVPMIFSIVILSPHGYFGQSGVLGLPDTGGQVVYILDQTRALELEMRRRLEAQGIDVEPEILVVTRLIPEAQGTSCDLPREPIAGTKNAQILRVPFRDPRGEVVPQWISRFEIWPYLERFAEEVEREVLSELGGRPGLLIGNYSDGNLVASLLSRRLGVTQCTIAHALEKTKYLMSDLFWRDNDDQYHFSCQFTADLIAMNTSDFIITSTYQEIAGTQDSVGQYESYSAFTMPGLYRVVNGVDVYDPKFNVVSPGADPEVYFPFTDAAARLESLHPDLNAMLHGDGGCDAGGERRQFRGTLRHPDRPIIFTMARLDRIKNLTGLVDWYGSHPRLRELANLFVIGGYIDPELSNDHEERKQVETMHALMDRHQLDESMRWIPAQTDRVANGELYRMIADGHGIFVQPALFEAYGLTVVEAMVSGLPTFATCYGGPLEIIEHGVSGFHIDPNHGDRVAEEIAQFFDASRAAPNYWTRISEGAVERIRSRYTWQLYGERMMTLARVYGFWKYVTNLERVEMNRYLEMFYGLQYRPLMKKMTSGDPA